MRLINDLSDRRTKILRLHHYSIHTERSYVEWIVRFVPFHGMGSRADLFPAEPKTESPSRQRKRRGRHPEPSHECLVFLRSMCFRTFQQFHTLAVHLRD